MTDGRADAEEAFLARAEAAIDKMALAAAGELDDAVEAVLRDFGIGVRAGWAKAFPAIAPAAIDGAVEDVLERIRARRRDLAAGHAPGRC